MNAKESTTNTLAELGELKLTVWDKQFGRFINLFEQIKHVDFSGQAAQDKFSLPDFRRNELPRMKELSFHAREVVAGGIGSIGAGALAGVAAYGGATMFASASTGTAIAALSGAAAKSATLAWFGGGALSAGGMGVAGGTLILGGLVLGPVLAVGGIFLSAKARKNLADAKINYDKARVAGAEMDNATSILKGIARVASAYQEIISTLDKSMDRVLDDLERLIGEKGTDYRCYSEVQKKNVWLSVQCAQAMKSLLEAKLLSDTGALLPSAQDSLDQGKEMVKQLSFNG